MRLLLLLVGSAVAVRQSAVASPLRQVIDMLESMAVKGKDEMKKEQKTWAVYSQFCADTLDSKAEQIAKGKLDVENYSAEAAANKAMSEKMGTEINTHQNDVNAWAGNMKSATAVRQIQNDNYNQMHKDYSESIEALQGAIKVLKAQHHATAQADKPPADMPTDVALLLQSLPLPTLSAKQVIAQFLQDDRTKKGEGRMEPPQAHAYEFQSGKVVTMLEGLLQEFVKERRGLEEKEVKSEQAYTMLMGDMKQNTQFAEDDISAKTKRQNDANTMEAEASGNLMDAQSSLEQNEGYVADMKTDCEQKKDEFGSRQKLRREEIEAIGKAVDVLKSNRASGMAKAHLPGEAFVQIHSENANPLQLKVAAFLSEQAKKYKSQNLALMSAQVGKDVFKKVKQMIKDLIQKLMEEGNSEIEQHGWCKTELSANERTRKEQTAATETLTANVDELNFKIESENTKISDLTAQNNQMAKDKKEAADLRDEQSFENKMTIRDAQDGQEALKNAIKILAEFYEKASTATALTQKVNELPTPPEAWSKPYKGMQDLAGGGILGLLKVCLADFEQLESNTKATEDEQIKAHTEFNNKTDMDMTTNSKNIEHAQARLAEAEKNLNSAKEDLATATEQLAEANRYYEKLRPTCVDSGESHKENVAKREEEIASLKDALKMLQ